MSARGHRARSLFPWGLCIVPGPAETRFANAAPEQAGCARQQLQALVYALSHDAGAPVRHVRAFAGLLSQSLPDLGEEQRQWLSYLDAGAELLTAMFERLLPLSRALEPVTPEPTSIDDLAATLGYAGPLPGGRVSVHPPRLAHALEELRTNAARYGPAAPAALTGEWDGALVRFVLRDGGPGIPQSRWSAALQPFNRLGQACEPAAVGLGLTIAAAAAEQGGGRLEWHPHGVALSVPLTAA